MQEPEPEEAAAGGLPVEPGQCPAERAEREPVPRLAEGRPEEQQAQPEETSAGGRSAQPEAEGLAAEPEAQGAPGEPAAVPEVAAVPAESA